MEDKEVEKGDVVEKYECKNCGKITQMEYIGRAADPNDSGFIKIKNKRPELAKRLMDEGVYKCRKCGSSHAFEDGLNEEGNI